MKLAYIISNINYSIAFEWISLHFENSDIDISFVFLNSTKPELIKTLVDSNVKCLYIKYNSKKDLLPAFYKTVRFLKVEKIQVVHCHLFEANLIGLAAAKILGLKKRIYTRHHSTYHHEYYPSAVKYDKIINWLSTDVIAISKNVENTLINKEGVSSKKIHLIYHGFDLMEFKNVTKERVNTVFKKNRIPTNKKIIGVIGRYIFWKGHLSIIEAFKTLIEKRNDIHLLLANANGPDFKRIKEKLKELPKNSYTEIEFEKDLFALFKSFDVYIHVPINSQIEAFGQTYIEALASGIPSIFTLSGIATEFITDKNALIVNFNNSAEIINSVELLLDNESKRNALVHEGYNAVSKFDKLIMMYCFNML